MVLVTFQLSDEGYSQRSSKSVSLIDQASYAPNHSSTIHTVNVKDDPILTRVSIQNEMPT